MSDNKKPETPDALDFNQGGNSNAGKNEKHNQPKAINGITCMKSPESKDADTK
jgi:hypothetical protein